MTNVVDEATASAALIVGRVPVVDREREIVGFELVNRVPPTEGPDGPEGPGGSGSAAMVSTNGLIGSVDVDLHGVVGDRLLFCSVDRGVLVGDTPLHLTPRRTVVEVPAPVDDPEALEAIAAFGEAGFTVLAPHECVARVPELLALVDIVRVDLADATPGQVMDVVGRYADADVRLLAQGCETEAELAWAQAVGFDLFTGPAVQAPEPTSASAIAPSALSQVQLGMELLSQDLDLERVEEILRGDPALVVQLLNMASMGAGGGLRRQVRSVREALVVMGTLRLKQWAALVILSRHGRADSDALVTALVRARMCEMLATVERHDGPFAFTAGLLSALDLVLGVPLEEVERELVVDEELARAAFWRLGPVGTLVDRVAAYQRVVAVGGEPDSRSDSEDLIVTGAAAFSWATGYVGAVDNAARSRS